MACQSHFVAFINLDFTDVYSDGPKNKMVVKVGDYWSYGFTRHNFDRI